MFTTHEAASEIVIEQTKVGFYPGRRGLLPKIGYIRTSSVPL